MGTLKLGLFGDTYNPNNSEEVKEDLQFKGICSYIAKSEVSLGSTRDPISKRKRNRN